MHIFLHNFLPKNRATFNSKRKVAVTGQSQKKSYNQIHKPTRDDKNVQKNGQFGLLFFCRQLKVAEKLKKKFFEKSYILHILFLKIIMQKKIFFKKNIY